MKGRFAEAFLLCVTMAQAQTSFEVASVKPLQGRVFRANISIAGDRVTASGPLKHLVQLAYRLKDHQVAGGPEWMSSGTMYEVTAKVEGDAPPSQQQVREMLQTLLAERFRLSFHRETREIPVYFLIAGKSGPNLKQSAPDATTGSTFIEGPASRIVATESMASLANQLQLATGLPVIDKTELSGLYEVKLEWSAGDATTDLSSAPSLYTALQEQLGLKLQPSREPFPVLVIDRAEKPLEN